MIRGGICDPLRRGSDISGKNTGCQVEEEAFVYLLKGARGGYLFTIWRGYGKPLTVPRTMLAISQASFKEGRLPPPARPSG
jgi:hypothetical protein